MIHARMYTGTARPPVTTVAATQSRRTSDGSRSKYSAMPPATPAHMRSRLLRINRRGGGGGAYGGYPGGAGAGVDAGGGGVGGKSAMRVLSSCLQRFVGLKFAACAGRTVLSRVR